MYAGSYPGADPRYAEAAEALAREIGRRGLGIVYGGGSVGLMGVLADAALAAGAPVTGSSRGRWKPGRSPTAASPSCSWSRPCTSARR